MTHPLEHLAPYVDGVLAPSERAAIDEHLHACARCRREVSAAQAAREALRALPQPTAPDLASHFTPGRIAAVSAPGPKSRPPWARAVPALAAAAVVALVALAVPRLGGISDDANSGGVEAADGAIAPTGPVRLALDDTDYDVAGLQDAATAFAATLSAGAGGAAGSAPAESAPAAATPADQLRTAGPERTAEATRCLRRAFPGFPGEIVAARLARFEGDPAYLGFVLEGPGADTAPDTLSIWVASSRDCSILSITSVRL